MMIFHSEMFVFRGVHPGNSMECHKWWFEKWYLDFTYVFFRAVSPASASKHVMSLLSLHPCTLPETNIALEYRPYPKRKVASGKLTSQWKIPIFNIHLKGSVFYAVLMYRNVISHFSGVNSLLFWGNVLRHPKVQSDGEIVTAMKEHRYEGW